MGKPDIEGISLRMENIWRAAGLRTMQDIVRRIKKESRITSTANYQINRLLELGKSTEEVERILKEALHATYPEMFELYDEVANWQYVRNRDVYEQVNGRFIPPEENEWLQKMSEAVKRQTKDELANLAQSYGFSVMIGNRRVFTPFSMYYHQYVDAAIMDIISGSFDYNTVIRRVVKQMTDSGLRTVDYATGRSNRVDVAVRRAVMTGISQITGKINERTAKELGTDYFEVDWHANARPSHREWQGKVYSKEELETVCGLHTVTGLCGANCRHSYYAFVPGASKRMYPDEWLEEQNRREAETKTWQGKEYDAYGRTQKQRQMETAMRAQREKVQLLKDSGADKDEVMLARCKYQAQLNEYSRYCKKMNLPEQRQRIYYDMRGRVASSKVLYKKYVNEKDMAKSAAKSVANSGKGDIINVGTKAGSTKYRELKRNKIIEKGISQKRAIYTADDFGKFASRIPSKAGTYDIALHGSQKTVSFYGERIDADTLAKIVKARNDYDKKSAIRLLSCNTGKGEDCFAQRLANKLGVSVEAPDDIIWARSDGTYTIGPTRYKNTGKMIKFYPERE